MRLWTCGWGLHKRGGADTQWMGVHPGAGMSNGPAAGFHHRFIHVRVQFAWPLPWLYNQPITYFTGNFNTKRRLITYMVVSMDLHGFKSINIHGYSDGRLKTTRVTCNRIQRGQTTIASVSRCLHADYGGK